jgi:hypothetical protein
MTKASIPQLLHKRVSIRRSGKVVRDVLTQSLVFEIRQGRLKEDDEISADEKFWVRLDRHYQLARLFSTKLSSTSEGLPSDMEQRLNELSEMLKDLNQ